MLRAYDFTCEEGHVTERFIKATDSIPEVILCEHEWVDEDTTFTCFKSASRTPAFWYTTPRSASGAPMPRMYRDHEGKLCPMMGPHTKLPEGATPVTIENIHQLRRVEREMNEYDQIISNGQAETRRRFTEGQIKYNREFLKARVEQFSRRGKAFYDAAQRITDEKLKRAPKTVQPVGYFEAFTQDSSNREGFYDERVESGKRGGRK